MNMSEPEAAPIALDLMSEIYAFCSASNTGTLISGVNQAPSGAASIIDAQAILDAMPFYVLLVDSNHKIVGANKTFYHKMKLDLSDVVGAYCPRLVHGLDHPFPGCPLEEAAAMAQPGPVERELFDPSTKHWMKSAIYPTGRITAEGHPIFLHTARDITAQKLASLKLDKQHELQAAVQDILSLSLKDISLEELLQQALGIILTTPDLGIEHKGCIFLVEGDKPELVMKTQVGVDDRIKDACSRVPFGQCLCGRAAQTQSAQFASNLDERHEIRYHGMRDHGHYCLPMVSGGKTLGVINTYLAEGHRKDVEEEGFLTSAADALSGVVLRKNAELQLKDSVVRLSRTTKQTILAISRISEEVDQYTAGHQRRVAKLARAIAEEMGLSPARIEGIEIAGLVHDIGKVAIPPSILSKPGRLNEFEMGLVRGHSKTGYNILKEVDFPWPIAQIVLQHHERLDGSGYPDGLSGDSILPEARIIAVADVFEAMSSHRPYRPALGVGAALSELSRQKGSFYDPGVVDACLKLVTEKGFKFT